ncbi:MAG TPA: DUF1315 family protein [Halioglobus sp.]
MNYLQLIESMTPEIYQSLSRSVELGRWPDGRRLTTEQRVNAMQAIIAWGERHLAQEDRVGYIETKQQPADPCETPAPLKWKD